MSQVEDRTEGSGRDAHPPAGAHDAPQSADLHDALSSPFPRTLEGRVLFWIAFLFALFQIATAAHLWDLPSQIVRAVHVGFLCLLGLPLVAVIARQGAVARALSWGLGLAGVFVAAYQWWEYRDLIFRAGLPTPVDTAVGIAALVVLFIATWRIMGPALPVIAGLFLAYCLFGQYAPGLLQTRGYPLELVVDHMAFGTEGIYGIPTYVSSTYIFLFILFGSFLERAGMIRLFTDVSLGLVGHAKGGAAKVSVISSGLMGTISGSGVANVVTTGQFTIPLMKRFGYRRGFRRCRRGHGQHGRADHATRSWGPSPLSWLKRIGRPLRRKSVKAAIIPADAVFRVTAVLDGAS